MLSTSVILYQMHGIVYNNYVIGSTFLFVPAVPDQGSSEDADIDRARDIQRKFIVMLTNYIHGNALKKTILQQITDILVCALMNS